MVNQMMTVRYKEGELAGQKRELHVPDNVEKKIFVGYEFPNATVIALRDAVGDEIWK